MEDVIKKIESLYKKTGKIDVCTAKMEEHLKTLNGTVGRHEKKLENIDDDIKEMVHDIVSNKVGLAKIMGAAIAGSALGGVIITAVLRVIGM